MCTILLVRHAEHTLTGHTLVGRDDAAVHLSKRGKEQARALAESLLDRDIDCIQSSPRVRCLETAAPLADALGLPVHVHNALDELDFGKWTGLRFEELQKDSRWHAWNDNRTGTRAPRGETMAEARARVLRHMEFMALRYRTATIAMFTHAEIIRAVKLHRAGLSANAWPSVDVPLASIATVEIRPTPLPESVFEAAAS